MSPASRRRLTTMSGSEQVKGPRSYFPSIESTYGRSIDEWFALLPTAGTTKHMELVGWLKSEHGMGHGHANALVAEFLRS
jgi:hypothetical protein